MDVDELVAVLGVMARDADGMVMGCYLISEARSFARDANRLAGSLSRIDLDSINEVRFGLDYTASLHDFVIADASLLFD